MFELIVTFCKIFFISFLLLIGIASLFSRKKAIVLVSAICLLTLVIGTGITMWFFSSPMAEKAYERYIQQEQSTNICLQSPNCPK